MGLLIDGVNALLVIQRRHHRTWWDDNAGWKEVRQQPWSDDDECCVYPRFCRRYNPATPTSTHLATLIIVLALSQHSTTAGTGMAFNTFHEGLKIASVRRLCLDTR